MHVTVEEDMCEGHGLCVDIAPEVFRLRDDGLAEVVLEEPDVSLEESAKEAARKCPASAIAIALS